MRDDIKLRADIFRPVTDDLVPAIVMWGPFGKSGTGPLNLARAALRAGVPKSKLSGYESFEGLDPTEWVSRGYAVVNVDSRGSGDSEGNLRWWGTGEGQDGYDFIEAIAAQPWCSGRVALAGNSWLAISQWFIAAQHPPHLAAIAPLEGGTDGLRETIARGGIPSLGFLAMIQKSLIGRQQQEDVVGMSAKYQNGNSQYWRDKRADPSQIRVPAYIGGSYSTNLHTLGAFRGFDEIPHAKKWLFVHDSQEWHDLYSANRTKDLAKFFDFYLKGVQNGWEDTIPVRLSVLGFNQPNQVYSYPSLPWTQGDAKKLRLYLNADQMMSSSPDERQAVLSYQADAAAMNRDDDDRELCFTYTFPERTVIAGPSKATITVSAEKQDDLDVYVMLRKVDKRGNILQSINQPLSDLGVSSDEQVPSVAVLKYLGPQGMLRASKREVAPELSSPWWPTLSYANYEPVPQGQSIRLEIALWPTGMVFEAGETLMVKVSGHDMRLVDFEALQGSFQVANKGSHYVHFGPGYSNFLDLNLL